MRNTIQTLQLCCVHLDTFVRSCLIPFLAINKIAYMSNERSPGVTPSKILSFSSIELCRKRPVSEGRKGRIVVYFFDERPESSLKRVVNTFRPDPSSLITKERTPIRNSLARDEFKLPSRQSPKCLKTHNKLREEEKKKDKVRKSSYLGWEILTQKLPLCP